MPRLEAVAGINRATTEHESRRDKDCTDQARPRSKLSRLDEPDSRVECSCTDRPSEAWRVISSRRQSKSSTGYTSPPVHSAEQSQSDEANVSAKRQILWGRSRSLLETVFCTARELSTVSYKCTWLMTPERYCVRGDARWTKKKGEDPLNRSTSRAENMLYRLCYPSFTGTDLGDDAFGHFLARQPRRCANPIQR